MGGGGGTGGEVSLCVCAVDTRREVGKGTNKINQKKLQVSTETGRALKTPRRYL